MAPWTARAACAVALLALAPALAGAATGRAMTRDSIRAMVVAEAKDMRFPAPLALAVAHAESNFDAGAESHKGARGVMQIMPAVAIGEYGIHPDLLWDPRINIRLGIHFLKRLVRRYRGRTDLALSYYNGGSAVGDLPHARVLPATYGYVRTVASLNRRYQREIRSGVYLGWTQQRPQDASSRPARAAN